MASFQNDGQITDFILRHFDFGLNLKKKKKKSMKSMKSGSK